MSTLFFSLLALPGNSFQKVYFDRVFENSPPFVGKKNDIITLLYYFYIGTPANFLCFEIKLKSKMCHKAGPKFFGIVSIKVSTGFQK